MELRDAKHILFCLRWGIGDVVIQTALLSPLRLHARHARITALGARPATELLFADERVSQVVAMDDFGLLHCWHEGEPDTRERVVDWIAEQRFDAVLDPHVTPSAVSGAIWATDMATFESNQPAEEAVLCAGGDAVAALLAGAHAGWGVPPAGETAPSVRIRPADRRRAAVLPEADGCAPIAFAPFASHDLKRWPAARFADVADELAAEGHRILLFSSPHDDAAERVRAAMRADAAVAPPRHLGLTAALLARCRALVANDTGIMHLGAAVGTPTIGVFGPSDPFAYRPHAAHSAAVGGDAVTCSHRRRGTLQPPDCSGAGRCLLGLRSCIDGIDEDRVLDAVRVKLETGGAARSAAGTAVARTPRRD